MQPVIYKLIVEEEGSKFIFLFHLRGISTTVQNKYEFDLQRHPFMTSDMCRGGGGEGVMLINRIFSDVINGCLPLWQEVKN